ncbi:MAG TPA: lysozyme inhibitor LprI family protein [Candidatus Acidoferrum sp.]|nr:lysozyme inhibitor LprI family protein [Candidatus Acidoferrum sp.]
MLTNSTFVAALALMLTTIGPVPVAAAIAPSADACARAQTQALITACVDMEARNIDATVNKTYLSVRRHLSGRRRTRLEAAQRTWLAYRNAECDAVAGVFSGGTIEATYRASCRADLDRSRIAALRWQLHPEQPLGTARPSP